ncbi:MAG: hypothetical protein WBA74_22095 [Cyclobacteriaceae bacterium]
MDPIFKKLNFKAQKDVLVINAPDSFRENIEAMADLTNVHTDSKALKSISFILAFVTKQSDIDKLISELYRRLEGDAMVWFSYPKSTSKKYTCDFNRDTGWQAMGEHGMEAVRMVAIDKDWSVIRFRKVEYIKKMKRRESFALSKEGKKKAEQKGK